MKSWRTKGGRGGQGFVFLINDKDIGKFLGILLGVGGSTIFSTIQLPKDTNAAAFVIV